jgi:hypothetical protein
MNVALYYFGGSGGFYALWHILLGTKFKCEFASKKLILENYETIKGSGWPKNLPENYAELTEDILKEMRLLNNLFFYQKYYKLLPKIYEIHWNINNIENWKKTEIWPLNEETKTSCYNNKLFFYCNPSIEDYTLHKNDFQILLYTDWDTQKQLAFFKKAHGFNHEDVDLNNYNTITYCKQKVDYKLENFLSADLVLKLQDIIKTSGQSLLEPLNYKIKQDNIDHNKFWLSLHNDYLKNLLTS